MRVSVIIPARNEAITLPALLTSLQAQQHGAAEVIVVDDGSTDATATVAQQHGARVIASGPLPSGWRGKTWACDRGAAEATGEVFVFLDADTRMHPGCLGRLHAAIASGYDAVSVCPYQLVPLCYEQLSAFFVLMMAAGVGDFAVAALRRKAGLFGQCLAITREAYEGSGGHASVKGRTLENLFLGQRLHAAGSATLCCGGRGLLDVRMYPDGLRQLADGWSKAFVSGAAATPRVILLLTTVWISVAVAAVIMPLVALVDGDVMGALLWACVYGVMVAQIGFQLRRLGSFKWYASVVYPVTLGFYMAVFGAAVVKRLFGVQAEWKERSIDG